MAIDDNTSYELTGAQVKDLAAKIKGKAADNTFTGATSAVAGVKGIVPEPQAGDNTKYLKGDGTWATIVPSLVEMSYGESSAWSKFINAYNAGSIVYCRASSNTNPATGTQGRKAFMAYVNNATSPTEVEFQYVRSVSSKTDSQQSDQVFIYKLTNASGGTWTVTTRNMTTKINVDSTLNKTYTSGANASVSLGAKTMTGATSGAAGTAGIVPAPAAGDQSKFLSGAGTWASPPIQDYSTSEVNTGATWIDGKPIYKKTIDCGALPNTTGKSIAHGISNFGDLVKLEGGAIYPGYYWMPLPYPDQTTAGVVGVILNNTDVYIFAGNNRSDYTKSYVTIYYTKTTD